METFDTVYLALAFLLTCFIYYIRKRVLAAQIHTIDNISECLQIGHPFENATLFI